MTIHTQRHFVPELLTVLVCLAGAAGVLARPSGGAAVSLELKSPDFTAGGNIPKQFTCEGANISPAFEWNAPPAATQSFVLIADDPDAPVGTWVELLAGPIGGALAPVYGLLPGNPFLFQLTGGWLG